MEPVNELDIDGYRWEIKDTQARQDIAKLKVDSDKKIEELNANLDLLKNEIYEQKKVNVILYDEFDIKNDNIQNRLFLLGDILIGSLYLRFDDAHNPFLTQIPLRTWFEIAEVPEVKEAPQLYNYIRYADLVEGFGKGDIRIANGKLSLRIKERPVAGLENWYIFYQGMAIKSELPE